MAEHRIPELDLATRVTVALEMLKPISERRWGWVTEMARTYNVSRTLLYKIRDRALEALAGALSAHSAGRPPQTTQLRVDKVSIAILPMLIGTVRGIQQGLDLLFGIRRSVGYVSQTLNAAGATATAHNFQITVRQC